MIREILKKTAMVTIFLTTMLALAFTAGAGIGGFSLSAELADGRHVTGNIELLVTPGETHEVRVHVRNGRDSAIAVELSLNAAITNAGGLINYGTRDAEFDDSMQYNFGDLAHFPTNGENAITVEIPAMTTAIVPMTVTVPSEGFDGSILGGIHALLGMTEAERAQAGMIANRFANIMPVRLRMEETPVEPDFALGEIFVDVAAGARGSYIARVHNIAPRIANNALASMWIIPAGADQAIFTHENMVVNFAPNAIFHFVVQDRARYGIYPGDYIARVRIEYDGRIWEFEEGFTVTAAAARAIAEGAVGQAHMLDVIGRGPSVLTIVLISLAVLLLAAVAYLLWKNKKAQAEQQGQPATAGAAPETTGGGAIDKLKGMDEDKLAKLLEQMQEQDPADSDK